MVIRVTKPLNSEAQARMAATNPSWGRCNKQHNHRRLLHPSDITQGNLDCAAPGCSGQYEKEE